jgi:epoxyqueuosine reductase
LRQRAEGLGLVFLGTAELGEEPDFTRYLRWIEEKRHAGMAYLTDHLELRRDPRALLEGARSVVVVGLGYYLGDKLRARGAGGEPRVAQYARLRDYHKVLRRRCEELAEALRDATAPRPVATRVVVDSAPILERALAARAGGGFVGKNTCLIHPREGSWLLLAEIVTSLDLPSTVRASVDPARRGEAGGCGSCRRCQVFCPTGALDRDYTLDANRCLAYWTIEHRGTIPERFWPWLGQYYFGCDICQLACPYNRGAKLQASAELVKLRELPPLHEVAVMDHAAYERMFGGTPLTRAKRQGLKRNALIAMAVTRHPRLEEAMARAVRDEPEAVVAETVAQIRAWLSREAGVDGREAAGLSPKRNELPQ